jgi:C_GCAxxG_C_C family probable redox protein
MPSKSDFANLALELFDQGYSCSQSVLLAYAQPFDLDERTAKLISSTFGGGMGRLRQTCGAVTGGFMVLGLAYGNESPTDKETKLDAYRRVRELNHKVVEIHGTSNCAELLKKHAQKTETGVAKHTKTICNEMVAQVVELVFDMLASENKLQENCSENFCIAQ